MTERAGEAKRERLARLLRERGAGRANGAPAGPVQPSGPRRVDRGGELLLSSSQERVWFQEQLLPASVTNMLVLLRASGPVDPEAMRRSIATVVERQESLRTVYAMVDGRPVQRITPFLGWSLPLVDLRHHGAESQRGEVRRRSRALFKAPFDLECGPLLRTELLRLADDDYLLVSVFHHIVSDGWSVEVYFDELAACYAAFSTGEAPRLPELKIQYADFAQWHRTMVSGKALDAQKDYWKARLAGQLPVLEAPLDHPRPTERTYEGRARHATIDSGLLASLRELSRREGVTLYTTLLTVFKTLLLRHTEQEDLLVGTFVTGRHRLEVEGLIGLFVNTLALRTDLSGNPSFREALARSRDVVLGAHNHAEFPFEKVIEELQPLRDLGLNPLSRVIFNKISIGRELEIESAGVRFGLVPSFEVHAETDSLVLYLSEGRDQVDLWYVYATELYEDSTIALLQEHMSTLLEGVVVDPDQRLWDLPLIREQEETRLRCLSEGATLPHGEFVPFHRRFEARTKIRPHAVALSSGEDRCTYAELNARANRVAHRLRELGVGPGVLVGICVERSFDLVAGLIGIQKAGGAYVPLDPDLPGDRLAFMLADSGARVLVTGGGVPDQMGGAVLRLDLDLPESLEGAPDNDLEEEPGPDSPVYVIYTSGSTGRPKGVTVPHRALANFLDAMLLSPGLSERDVVAGVTTISFDISGLELYLPLRVGARIELVSRADASDGVALAGRLAACGATLLQATPATWRLLLEANWRGNPGFRAFCGGESLTRELADALLSRVGEVWNLYGPTETTIWSTAGRVAAGADPVDVGRPIANTRIHIVDPQGRLAPTGAPGEVWIGGDGVAAGYHRRPELSAERFVEARLSGNAAARLYRTGDRGRWRHDGTLELLGRLDSQVKVRGFRIELGEIEAVLVEHPGVRAAAASVRDKLPGGPGLVAYIVPDSDQPTLLDEIRRRLRARLPDYMVPSRIVLLERLPLTHSGKLDRRALAALDAAGAESDAGYAPLRGPTEESIGAIWREVLGVDRVGRSDNFFELGGHSLMAMRVIARLRDTFGGEIPVRRMFEMQTVGEIAAYLDQRAGAERRMTSPIPQADVDAPRLLSSAWERQDTEAAARPFDLVRGPLVRAAPIRVDQELHHFLARLRALGVQLSADGDRLRCSAPRGVLTAELQELLAARKAELLALVRAERSAEADSPVLGPVSFAQERLWFLDQLHPGVAAYHITGALRLEGRLDVGALNRVITEILRRHGALRTTFTTVDDQPMQVVHPPAQVELAVSDLSGLSEDERDRQIRELAREASRRSFDLTRGPLFRAELLQRDRDDHVLLIAIHHIVADGWSLGVLVAELSALYAAFTSGRPSPLPELATQYLDHARWQRGHFSGEALQQQVAYWRRQLGGGLAVLDLPADRARPAEQSFAGRYEAFVLPGPLAEAVRALARREQSTLFMVLLAAFQTLLHRYTGQTDIPVGIPIANRSRLETEGLIGFFTNTLVMRADLSGEPTFKEVLQRVRVMALDAYAHQDIPFGKVVEELQPVRDRSRTPLFQAMFALQNVPSERLSLPGLSLTMMMGERGTAKTDLLLEMSEQPEGLVAVLEYCTDLFDATTILRLWEHYVALLQALVDQPGLPVTRLRFLSTNEETQLVIDWNRTALDHDRAQCVHHLLEESARRGPDAPAVVAGEVALDYRALDRRANRLARLLGRRGVGRGSLVAVCLDRTIDLPVTLAAVLKAGGAYVPLDPSHPADRLCRTIDDAGVRCIVTHSRFLPLLAGTSPPVLQIDQCGGELATQSDQPPGIEVHPEDLAYVIYTSGSTGVPKGVEVEHRNVVSFLTAMRREPGLTDRDVLLAVTTPAFDIAGLELWLPLTVGARVVIASRADVLDPERLITLLEHHDVTAMQATPATWRLLIDAGWEGRRSLKALCGGEALPPDLALALDGRVGELWNMYGPTETTIWSTTGRVDDGAPRMSLGRPIANTRAYVLDPADNPAPIGAAGELCIAGEGVARGYRNLPELTAEKFVVLDLPGRPAERLYRTGDIARRRADGSIEYLGRRDQQVKLRGYRIELGEIEAALRTVPEVTDCAVTVQETAPGQRGLVAYVALGSGDTLDPEAARVRLRARLPEYMVPSMFVTLPALPLTANGKLDRKALPAPAFSAEPAAEVETAFMTPMECRVAAIWLELLGRTRVGLHDNFFDVGGHSLLAVRLHSRLKRDLGAEFPLIDLFQHSTVAAQADLLAGGLDPEAAIAAGGGDR